jgi:DNA-binding transcriptional MocR family regulator
MPKPVHEQLPESYVRELLRLAAGKIRKPLSGGLPDPELLKEHIIPRIPLSLAEQYGNPEEFLYYLFDLENQSDPQIKRQIPYLAKLLGTQAEDNISIDEALTYSGSYGIHELREFIAETESERTGLDLSYKNIIITPGSQQMIFMTALDYALNKTMACGMPTYVGAGPVFQLLAGLENIHTIPIDSQGADVTQLWELKDRYDINYVYAQEDGHNPASVDISTPRITELVDFAVTTDTAVLSDNPYASTGINNRKGVISYNPSLSHIIKAGTFSKETMNVRIGWGIANKEVIDRLSVIQGMINLHPSVLDQAIVLSVAKALGRDHNNSYNNCIDQVVVPHYISKRKQAVQTAREVLKDWAEFDTPEHGLFLWLKFLDWVDSVELNNMCLENYGTAFVPGPGFDPHYRRGHKSQLQNYARVNYSNPSIEMFAEGLSDIKESLEIMANSR